MTVELFTVPMTGGVNLFDDPRTIRDDEMVLAKNIFPHEKGVPGKRLGMGNSVAAVFADLRPTSVFIPPFPFIEYVVTAVDTGMAMTPKAYVYVKAPGDDAYEYESIEINRVLGYTPVCVAFNREIYVLHGYQDVIGPLTRIYLDPPHDPSPTVMLETQALAGGNTSLNPRAASPYRSRMVWGNLGQGYENWILFSDVMDPLTCPEVDTHGIAITELAGDRIVALVEVMQSQLGAPPQSALLVLGERRCVVVTGQPEQSTYTGDEYQRDLSVNEISYDVGCASPHTVVRTPYGIVWASHDDVWMFNTGQLPTRIGTKIRPVLEEGAYTEQFNWHAAYHDGVYRLAVFTGSGTHTDGWQPCDQQWWLDLRDGPPRGHADARWWGPMVYRPSVGGSAVQAGTRCMVGENRAGKASKLIGVEYGVHNASESGLVYVEYDVQEGWDSAMVTGTGNEGTSVAEVALSYERGNQISVEGITKSYSFGDTQTDKLFMGAELSIYTGDVLQLHWEARIDGGRVIEVGSKQLDHPDFEEDSENYQSILLPGSSDSRYPGKFIQFRFYDVAGWPVVENGINSQLYWVPDAASGTIITQDLTPGFYEDIDAFAAQFNLDVLDPDTGMYVVLAEDGDNRYLTLTALGGEDEAFVFIPEDTEAARRCRKVLQSLGYNTSASTLDLTFSSAEIADEMYRTKRSAPFRIGSLTLQVFRFQRRPEHSKE